MTSKINILKIVSSHISTLRDSRTDKLYWGDFLTFYGLPILVSGFFFYFGVDLSKDLVNIVVTTGSIFTALLLNLLILVYDQKSKLPKIGSTKEYGWELLSAKHKILKEVYFSISYSTLVSLLIVILAILQMVFRNSNFVAFEYVIDFSQYALTPLIFFFGSHLILTLLMIIKRIFLLLTTDG